MTIKEKLFTETQKGKRVLKQVIFIITLSALVSVFTQMNTFLFSVFPLAIIYGFLAGSKAVFCPKCSTNLMKLKRIRRTDNCPECKYDLNQE